MKKIKLLKNITAYNVSGFDKQLLSGKKNEIISVSLFNADILITDKLAIDDLEIVTSTALEKEEQSNFELTDETIIHIQELTKNDIEMILRLYDFEVDKRSSLSNIRKELVEIVGSSLPEEIALIENENENAVNELLTFYKDNFEIELPEFSYSADDLGKMSKDVGIILNQVFENDAS